VLEIERHRQRHVPVMGKAGLAHLAQHPLEGQSVVLAAFLLDQAASLMGEVVEPQLLAVDVLVEEVDGQRRPKPCFVLARAARGSSTQNRDQRYAHAGGAYLCRMRPASA